MAGPPRKNRALDSKASDSVRAITADLVAVLVAVTDGEPKIMTIANAGALPSGPFEFTHRSLQSGLRTWVEAQTGHPLGYVEQLYTFADRGRTGDGPSPHSVSISYLGLTREDQVAGGAEAHWSGWYDYFPWEDHRAGPPALLAKLLTPRLRAWAKSAPSSTLQRDRWQRAAITFGFDDREWNEELILQRYELLFEAALIPEAVRESGNTATLVPGRAMTADHRRILATGVARLRAKIKYRPVVFELMPAEFTLLQLQRSVEALAGRLVHKQNFRRLMEQQQLVEETGAIAADTVGRPAKLFRFRHAVLAERAITGTKLPLSRT
ncbi:MAG: NUDIX hydrolase [Bradyrhizobium sp.]